MSTKIEDTNYLIEEFSGPPSARAKMAKNSEFEFQLLDESNPRSMINIIQDSKFKTAVLKIPREYHLYNEFTLKQKLKPTREMTMLRLRFWQEYGFAQANEKHIRPGAVMRGVCTHEYFDANILGNLLALSWVIRPPLDDLALNRQQLYDGSKRLDAILKAPIYEKIYQYRNGQPLLDASGRHASYKKWLPSNMKAIITAVQFLDAKVNGAIVQKVDINATSRNLNLNTAEVSFQDLQSLKSQMSHIQGMLTEATDTIDVEGSDVEDDTESCPEAETSG